MAVFPNEIRQLQNGDRDTLPYLYDLATKHPESGIHLTVQALGHGEPLKIH